MSGDSSTPARCCSTPPRMCLPKKRVSWQPNSMTSPMPPATRRAPSTNTSPPKRTFFLAVSDRYWRRYFDNFAEVMASAKSVTAQEFDDIAARWRQLSRDRGAEHAALGHEFTLYLLRNPEARERVAAKRSEVVEKLSEFIVKGIDRLGGTLLIPPLTFAQVLIATSDSVILGSELDDVDLYRPPIVEMYTSAIKLP